MKQIAEQFHRGQSGDSTEGRWQQQPGNGAVQECVSLVTVIHGLSRKRGGNFSLLLFTLSPNIHTQPAAGQSTCMSQIFVFRQQRNHWIPSKIRGETRGEEKSIRDGGQREEGTDSTHSRVGGGWGSCGLFTPIPKECPLPFQGILCLSSVSPSPSAAAAGHFHGGEALPGALGEGLCPNPPLLHRLRRGPGVRGGHGLGHPRAWGHC